MLLFRYTFSRPTEGRICCINCSRFFSSCAANRRNLGRKLIKKPKLSSEAPLALVQEYEERYGPSVATPCCSTSVARQRQTRSVATQTFRNFTRPSRGRQACAAQVSN
ncbi:hypothetical protein SprV_0200829200 [Sparganum proliferum]